MIRKWWFRLGLLSFFCFLLGFAYNYHLPRFEQFLLVEAERLSQKHAPVRIWAKKLSVKFFPLGVVLSDVQILPQPAVERYLAPAQIKEAGVRIAILPLLRGEVRLSRIYISDSEFNIFLRPELFAKSGSAPKKLDFEAIYRLPIDEISFERVQVQGRLEPQNVVFRISKLNLLLENRYRSLFIDLDAPRALFKPSGPVRPLNAQLELRTLIEAEEAQISAFKLRADQSFVVASGRLNGDFAAGKIQNGTLDARAKITMPDLNAWEKVFFEKPRLPELFGLVEADVGADVRTGKIHRVDGEIKTSDLGISHYVIGTIQGRMASDLKTITSDQLLFQNNAGKALIQKLNLSLEPKHQISGILKAENLEIRDLLKNLGIKNVPISLPLNGEAQCQGAWTETPDLTCQTKIATPRFHVHSGGPKAATIVEALDLSANGEVKVTTKQVEYKGDLRMGKSSKGKSFGIINYENGFKISYEAENFDFADLKNLANIKFEGSSQLKGTTTGTSHWATLEMNFSGKNLWMDDYPFGEMSAKIGYRKGHLTLDEVQGQYEVSRYNGNIDIDLLASQLRVNAQIPFADLKDLQSVFQRKVDLPFKASGTGQGRIEARGPFRIQDMSYEVHTNFYRGQVANETFDELTFNVKSVNGMVKSEQVFLTKSSGVAELKGQINPKGEIDTVVVGRGMRLEQSENINALGFDLQGLADFTVLIHGQLPKPKIEVNGRFSRVVLSDQPAEDSVLKLSFLTDRMEGSGQFFGQTLLADVTWPYDKYAPFLLRAKARKWDFTSLFAMVSRSARQLDFSTSVTGEVNLQSASGGFWSADGKVQIDELLVRKGAKSMNADKPMFLLMHGGIIDSKNFAIVDGDNFVKLEVNGLKRDSLNASLNGKLDLSLLGLFTPFISDLRGQTALSIDMKGTLERPKVSGSAYIDKGYAKFTDFVHPFANAKADLLFNDNQIVLNSLRAEMAGGKIAGDGKLSFNGDSRPIDVKGTFQDVKLNFPESFNTGGSGTVAIYGNGFPYTMDIDYNVSGGEVTYEFGAESGGQASVKASAYLPRFMYQEAFHPFTFLVNVNLRSPVTVNNALMSANINGSVRAAGTPDRILLTGTLTPSPGAKVFFRDQPFDVTSAFVEYNGVLASQPKIYLTASTRVTESVQDDQLRTTEHQYDVNLLVQGRGPTPEIILTSQPPLSQREIVSLLALGVTTSSLDERRSSDFQATNTSTAVGAGLIQRAAGKRLKDTLGVDLKVSTSQPTPETAAQPKVTISKQWTPKFGASASSTLQANPSNNVKVEYKMNKNISVIGSWDGRENNLADQKDNTTKNVFGLDLEYKVQFK